MRRFDPSLYLVIGPADVPDGRLEPVVSAAVAGGVTMVQLRHKAADRGSVVDRARLLLALLRPHGVPLIVNDDPEAAVASGADGVHVGPFDRSPEAARAVVGPDAILGLSVTSPAESGRVDPTIVDYVGLGPVFATATKPDAANPIGLSGVEAGCQALTVPVVAIGGIHRGNALDVLRAGANGIAVVSAICSADPRSAAEELNTLIRLARTDTEEASA